MAFKVKSGAESSRDRTLLQEGAQQAVINCMRIQPNDRVVVIGDNKSSTIADALVEESSKITTYVKRFNLDDFGTRPLSALPAEIADELGKSTATFYAAGSYKASLQA